jgi:heptaprenyl diphosphate synthase
MSRSAETRTLAVTAEDRRIARYAAAAIALSVAEAAIPMPLPGVKPGLANIVVLVVLVRWGWRDAVWVSLLRVFAASLLLGQFLAPGFFLSLAGALASLAALGLAVHLPARWFGPVSHSLIAAFAHIAGQLGLARLWLVPHDGLVYLVPFFALAALVFGLANGLAAAKLLASAPAPGPAAAPVAPAPER